ncbi:hypothetical protein CYLTODRAFT_341112, partial [Cylindrobasidium torrendii FP15055 ss-10]
TCPFLIRTFLKVGAFHRLPQFEEGPLPTTDETQIFTWKDATLREVLTTIRDAAPHIAEYRHPLARYSFRTVFADASNHGHFTSKDLGQVYSRDILGEPGTLTSIAPKLLEDDNGPEPKEEKTLEELKLVPGDYLLVAVFLPKNVNAPSERGPPPPPPATLSRGGGHWRGESNGPNARGRGGRQPNGDFDRDRDRERDDDRIPPPRRGERGFSPPPRGTGWGPRGRGGGGGYRGGGGGRSRRSPSLSRSRSPPPRRSSRYD